MLVILIILMTLSTYYCGSISGIRCEAVHINSSLRYILVEVPCNGISSSQPLDSSAFVNQGKSLSPTKVPPVVINKIMTQIPEIPEGSGDSIKIGTVGTIGSLMSQELESMNSTRVASSSQKKFLTNPLSVPCADASKRAQPGKILSNETSTSNNHNAHHLSNAQKPKQKPLQNGQRAPILTNEAHTDKKTRKNMPNKKGRTYIVEVVDIKCNNPMSSRLKKLGFTKLSETIG